MLSEGSKHFLKSVYMYFGETFDWHDLFANPILDELYTNHNPDEKNFGNDGSIHHYELNGYLKECGLFQYKFTDKFYKEVMNGE